MLVQQIYEWAATQPDRTALIEGDLSTSYAQFARMIEAARKHLATEDLPVGKFAVVFSRTVLEKWVTVLALRALGLHTVTIATLALAGELGIRNVSCVVTTQEMSRQIGAVPAAFGGARLISVPQTVYGRDSTAPVPSHPGDAPPYGGYLICTSGTTGAYKKVFYEGALEKESILWQADAFSLDKNSIFHIVDFPTFTAIGAKCPPGAWYAGGCAVISSGAERLRDFFRHRPTHAILIPAMVSQLLEARRDGDALQTGFELGVGGGFLPLQVAERAVRHITPRVNVYYASTETSALLRSQFRSLEDLHWLTPHKSTIEIIDDAGNECAPGVEGELRMRRRDFDPSGYLDDDETTAKFFRDGCFYPGDLAVRREDGRIRVLGRTEDVVNVRGWKIAVAPLEELIQRRLGVDTVCVFSELDKSGEERIVIALESDRLPPEDKLAAAIQDRTGFERVRWEVLETFPRTEGGTSKVNRRKLRPLVTRSG